MSSVLSGVSFTFFQACIQEDFDQETLESQVRWTKAGDRTNCFRASPCQDIAPQARHECYKDIRLDVSICRAKPKGFNPTSVQVWMATCGNSSDRLQVQAKLSKAKPPSDGEAMFATGLIERERERGRKCLEPNE